jgi:poly(3-hydroxybutyrate) depolymerase
MEKSIIISEGKQPEFIGRWTIGEILAAADFLRRWIEAQQIAAQPPTAKPETAKDER